MSFIDTYAPPAPTVRSFAVHICAYTDTTTLPKANLVHDELSHDPRTRYISRILDSEMGNGYTINFQMDCQCSYNADGWITNPYNEWRNLLDLPLPDDCEVVDYYIL